MTKSLLTFLLFSCLIVLPAFTTIHAYGHGTGTSLMSRPVRIDSESFSTNQATTSDIMTITGRVENLLERPVELSLYIYVTPMVISYFDDGSRSGDMPWYSYLLDIVYPPDKDQSTWYFRVEHDLPNPVILEPSGSVPYEITLYPRKAGTFHVHTYFVTDDASYFGRGQTIEVSGENAPTFEEVTQLYLPLMIGAATITTLTFAAIRGTRAKSVKEKGIRIFFAVKASFETAWLLGIAFWLAAAHPYLRSLDAKYAVAIAMTAALAGITFGGYVATVSKADIRRRLFAIGTTTATVLFYLALKYDYPALGNQFKQFDVYAWPIVIIVNAVASVLIFVIAVREKGKAYRARQFH